MTKKKDMKDTNKTKGETVGEDKPAKVAKSRKGRKPRPVAVPETPKKKKKRIYSPKITAETYNQLQTAYYVKQTVSHAAKEAGVSHKTAKCYIDGPGKPDVGMLSIKELWLDVQTEVQERKQITLVSFQTQQVKELEEIVGTSLGELKLIRAEVVRRVNKYKNSGGMDLETGATLSSALKSYERACKLMERMLGREDLKIAASVEDRYKNWTDDEVLLYMETGKVPDHAR